MIMAALLSSCGVYGSLCLSLKAVSVPSHYEVVRILSVSSPQGFHHVLCCKQLLCGVTLPLCFLGKAF